MPDGPHRVHKAPLPVGQSAPAYRFVLLRNVNRPSAPKVSSTWPVDVSIRTILSAVMAEREPAYRGGHGPRAVHPKCRGIQPPQHIRRAEVGRFVVRHAAAGNEPARFNTRDFDIQTSPDGNTLTTRATVRANTAAVTTHSITRVTARFIRLNVITPTQDGDPAARIYELEAYSN